HSTHPLSWIMYFERATLYLSLGNRGQARDDYKAAVERLSYDSSSVPSVLVGRSSRSIALEARRNVHSLFVTHRHEVFLAYAELLAEGGAWLDAAGVCEAGIADQIRRGVKREELYVACSQ